MVSTKTLDKIKTFEAMQEFAEKHGISLDWEISYRGGGFGVWGSDLAKYLHIDENDLPRKFGCGCNYLGGGVRGAIFPSGYNENIKSAKVKEFLDAFSEACIRVYEYIENEDNLNEDGEDGEPNWDGRATKASRRAGIVSAY